MSRASFRSRSRSLATYAILRRNNHLKSSGVPWPTKTQTKTLSEMGKSWIFFKKFVPQKLQAQYSLDSLDGSWQRSQDSWNCSCFCAIKSVRLWSCAIQWHQWHCYCYLKSPDGKKWTKEHTVNIWFILMVIIWLMMVNNHLVGGFNHPLWKIWNSLGMMKFPTEWKVIKNVPKHQPEHQQ